MPPIAKEDEFNVREGQTRSLDVARRVESSTFRRSSLTVAVPPKHGTAAVAPDGTVRYTSDSGYFGKDSFTYSIADAAGHRSQATISLTVEAVNDKPVVSQGISNRTPMVAVPMTIMIPENAFADADPGAHLSLTAPRPLPLGLNFEDTKIVGTPQQAGEYQIIVRAEDEAGAAATTSFRLTVT